MKLLKSVIFAAAVVSAQDADVKEDMLCQPCPANGKCDRTQWMKCEKARNICVCMKNWFADGDSPGCMGFESGANAIAADQCNDDGGDEGEDNGDEDVDEKPEEEEEEKPVYEAALCGKCKSKTGCGEDEGYMYCHKKIGRCVCMEGWGANANGTACSEESDEMFDVNTCKDMKPDIADEICPDADCGENEKCKIKEINEEYQAFCICADGFEFDEATMACVEETSGRCNKNTDCDMDGNEKCDKWGKKRCVCRDGFMRDEAGVCVDACGSYMTLDHDFDKPGMNMTDKPDEEGEKPEGEKPEGEEPGRKTYGDKPQGGKEDYDENMKEMMKDQMKDCKGEIKMKPQFCDENATCEAKEMGKMTIEMCKCNEGYIGMGGEGNCWNKDNCASFCEKKIPGSLCISEGESWSCACSATQSMMYYKDGSPCCVEKPMCETTEDCVGASGEMSFCFEGTCRCQAPMMMNKKGICGKPGDLEDKGDYEDGYDKPMNGTYEKPEGDYEKPEGDYGKPDKDEDMIGKPNNDKNPCMKVKCGRNAHCELDRKKEPNCVCDDGYQGENGKNCRAEGEEGGESKCMYGSCKMSMQYGRMMGDKPDFNADEGDACGSDDLNLSCMKDGCCGCAKNFVDANGKARDGCEARQNPCDEKNICSKDAECVDLNSEKPNKWEMEDSDDSDDSGYGKPDGDYGKPDGDYGDKPEKPGRYEKPEGDKPEGGKPEGGKPEGEDENPDMGKPQKEDQSIAIDSLGYRCVCKGNMEGIGIGADGCSKPESERVDECSSLKNPCGRNSMCIDKANGYECKCNDGYVSASKNGKKCVKPVDTIKPDGGDDQADSPCPGFCTYSKNNKDCHLRDLSAFHTKITDYMVMGGDGTEAALPGVTMKVVTKKLGFPLNRASYTAFLEFDQSKCGNVLLGAMMSGDVKVSVFDRAGVDGQSVYRVDGVQGFLTKTKTNSKAWSGMAVQVSKIAATLAELTGDENDFEENQFLKKMKDGSMAVKPDYDTFFLTLTGEAVTADAMGETKFKSCFNVRAQADDKSSKSPFDFILWNERSEAQETDTLEDREKLVTLDGDYTQCYLDYKVNAKNIKDIVCEEPLIVDGEVAKENPTFGEMVKSADKDQIACSEIKE